MGTCSIPIKEELVTWRWLKAVCLLVGNDHHIESILFLTKASMAWKALGGACQKVSTAPQGKNIVGTELYSAAKACVVVDKCGVKCTVQ